MPDSGRDTYLTWEQLKAWVESHPDFCPDLTIDYIDISHPWASDIVKGRIGMFVEKGSLSIS